jgi:hypothetical protein
VGGGRVRYPGLFSHPYSPNLVGEEKSSEVRMRDLGQLILQAPRLQLRASTTPLLSAHDLGGVD